MNKSFSNFLSMSLVAAIICISSFTTASENDNILGDLRLGQEKSSTCVACHGIDGNSIVDSFPKIAGQHASYISKSLIAYRNGNRKNAIMAGIAGQLSDKDIADLAAYFSGQTASKGAADPKLVSRGEQIYRFGDFEKNISACASCHGPNGLGMSSAAFPSLGGQWSKYIVTQLKLYHSGERKNIMMNGVATKLSEDDMISVASYIEGLR